jgi:SulP family sulfate permease
MVLDLGRVPVIDSTGFVALENAIARLLRDKKRVIIAGPLPRPKAIWTKARLQEKHAGLEICASLDDALEISQKSAA